MEWEDDPSAGVNRFNLAPGVYRVLITESAGCTINREFTIQDPAPISLEAIITNAEDCTDSSSGSINLIVSGGMAPYSFDWNNGFASTEDLENISAGSYFVQVTDSMGCTESSEFVVIRPDVLNASIITTTEEDCASSTVTQFNEAIITGGVAPYTINWSGGGLISGSNNQVLETWENGTYTLEIIDAAGCIFTDNIVVDLPTIGAPEFTYESDILNQYGVLVINDPISFTDISTGDVVSYLWDFGDGVTSTEMNPVHSYSQVGKYLVKLTVIYPFNCSYTYSQTIEITAGYNLAIPNGFTPNGDNINDLLRPVFTGMTNVEMRIYDTWGTLIYFEQGETLTGWDGMKNGKNIENGNYIMRVKAITITGEIIDKSEPITLIK